MKKAILALFMTVAFASASTFKGNNFITNPTLSHGLVEFVDTSCGGAVAGFNKGIKQLIHNIQTNSNQWLVYSDLDALDGFAYHLQNVCNPEDLSLTSKLEGGQTPEQQQACSNLLAMLGSILDQNQPRTFKTGYELGLAWSQQALTLGPNITEGCKIQVEVNVETPAAVEEEWGLNEENNESGEYNNSSDDSDAMLGWDVDIFAQKKSHEDCDSDDAQNSSDDSEDDSEKTDDDSDDDSDNDSDDSDDSNEEERAGEEWNNEEWTTKAWNSEEWTTEAQINAEWTTKAWDSEEWASESQTEEWALKGWDNGKGDWSDWNSHSNSDNHHGGSTFFYEVNPNGNTDSGNDWMNGDYQRYIPGGSGNPGSSGTGTSGIPPIPGIPSIPGNPGGAKATFLSSIGQQASGNPWMNDDYKKYYDGGNGGAKTPTFLAAKNEKKDSDDSDNPWKEDYKKYYDENAGDNGPKKPNFFYWAI